MVDLRKKYSWHKIKTLLVDQTRNRRWIKPSIDRNELKDILLTWVLRQGRRRAVKTPHKEESNTEGRKSTGLRYHPPTRKRNFRRTLMIIVNGYLKIT